MFVKQLKNKWMPHNLICTMKIYQTINYLVHDKYKIFSFFVLKRKSEKHHTFC
jgi:hypothetical protein